MGKIGSEIFIVYFLEKHVISSFLFPYYYNTNRTNKQTRTTPIELEKSVKQVPLWDTQQLRFITVDIVFFTSHLHEKTVKKPNGISMVGT